MRGSSLGLLAAIALVAGVAGCSLPEVLPMAGGTTQGPSPYGPWYEQHWATNSVLLAAADQPETLIPAADDATASDDATPVDEAAQGAQPAAVEANAAPPAQQNGADFDNSSPYQFPASAFSPAGSAATEPPADDTAPSAPAAPEKNTAPAPGGPIRY
jgi:hypothetical protein